jgi:hypothetical protein
MTWLYAINDKAMLVPDGGVEMQFSDLDSGESGRDESGFMHRMVLRSRVRTWGFTYEVLTAEEKAYLESLIAGKATFRFQNEGAPCEAYCAKQEVRLYSRTHGLYKGWKFSIIEC